MPLRNDFERTRIVIDGALLQARAGATEQVGLSAQTVDRHHVRQGLKLPTDYSPLQKNSWP
jgi:hypothetical protein